MNYPLGLGEVRQIKIWLAQGVKFPHIVWGFAGTQDRDVIVEVVDAIRRTDSAEEALELAEACIASRRLGTPLINQKPAEIVLEGIDPLSVLRTGPRNQLDRYAPWR